MNLLRQSAIGALPFFAKMNKKTEKRQAEILRRKRPGQGLVTQRRAVSHFCHAGRGMRRWKMLEKRRNAGQYVDFSAQKAYNDIVMM